MIVWDAGTAITGSGTVIPGAPFIRVVLDVIPPALSTFDVVPVRYRYLGTVGDLAGSARNRGQSINYADAILQPGLNSGADGLYWWLENGVSGTLYRGVETLTEVAVGARVYASAVQSLGTGALTAITFDLEAMDPFGLHSPSSNPARITIATPGWYHVGGEVAFAASATGNRNVVIMRNGTDRLVEDNRANVGAVVPTKVSTDTLYYLSAGDYVEVHALQDSGGPLNTVVTTGYLPALWAVRVA